MTDINNIKSLIICSPYKEPDKYLHYVGNKKFKLKDGRRPASYIIVDTNADPDSHGTLMKIDNVDEIRKSVKIWQDNNYPGATSITKELLSYWKNRDERQFFFCQIEAIETIIWAMECPIAEEILSRLEYDESVFRRYCSKMATGTGKTIVMAMLIVWQILNHEINPNDERFTKNFLVVTPNCTIKDRLSVLDLNINGNYYKQFNLIPDKYDARFFDQKISILNRQALIPKPKSKKYNVVKIPKPGSEAIARHVLKHNRKRILVINDEAHHAYRSKDEHIDITDDTTVWMEALDYIHKSRTILSCHDFTATPFIPSGKAASDDELFGWIISDFGLNDAVESGLVKTPMVARTDNSKKFDDNLRSRLYHIYNDPTVKGNIGNTDASKDDPLPPLIVSGYKIMASSWKKTRDQWLRNKKDIPPVLLTVCMVVEDTDRITNHFRGNSNIYGELSEPSKILKIHSKDVDNDPEHHKEIRLIADTVGKKGGKGEQITNVISIQMLSEGWDAHNVTHIMGLRAFRSQLLCEQVVGRGLRRSNYTPNSDGFLDPEYVDIFGVPFAFMPHVGDKVEKPDVTASKDKIPILVDKEKFEYDIIWPIGTTKAIFKNTLEFNLKNIKTLSISSPDVITSATTQHTIKGNFVGPKHVLEGKQPSLQSLGVYIGNTICKKLKSDGMSIGVYSTRKILYTVLEFLKSEKLQISELLGNNRRNAVIESKADQIIAHLYNLIKADSKRSEVFVYHEKKATSDMSTWMTTMLDNIYESKKSIITPQIYDSGFELKVMKYLDSSDHVLSWVKNDKHIGFSIKYMDKSTVEKDYYPDFIVKLVNSKILIIETKGREDVTVKIKNEAAKKWSRLVTDHGGFGIWLFEIVYSMDELHDALGLHLET